MRREQEQLIVVTGAAGFIGSCVLRQLNDQGIDSILAVDFLRTGEKWKNLVGKRFAHFLEKQELFDWLEGRQDQVKAFIHLGACSDTVEADASYLLHNNYRYTVRLAEYALTHGKRFIYASSAATYGDGSQGFSDDESTLESLKPLNMYGYSKQLFDLWAKRQGVLHELVGLKYFNVYGPNEYHKGRMASAITRMVPEIQKEGGVRLFKSSDPAHFGDGEQRRDFVFVKDVVKMTCAFLTNQASGIFNVGTGQAATWNELARAVFKALNQPVRIDYVAMPQDLQGKYQNFTQAEMTKTHRALGNVATATPLESAVVEYVRDYLLSGARW